jgi:hypothetical protein
MAGGIWDSDFEDDELGDELALQPALPLNRLAYRSAPPAAPASPRSPRLVVDDARALAKPFVGVSVKQNSPSHPFQAYI